MGSTRSAADRLYKLLEVDRSASRSEIRKAHQRLAREHHPDRPGGDAEKFREIQEAYETLSDPEKRARYDQFGEVGADGPGPSGAEDLFDLISGSRRPQRPSRPRSKTSNVVKPLPVTLEQLYAGVTKKMSITRQVVDAEKVVKTCAECEGHGTKVESVRVGPMIQQVRSECAACGSTGKSFSRKQEREVLEVHVPKGAPDGHSIAFREKANQQPDADPGDVIFLLKEKEHPVFKRKGADLYVERTISLVEALCGFQLELTHLDGRKLLIKTNPGEVVAPLTRGFDPLASETAEGEVEWDRIDGYDCPDIDTVAEAEAADVDLLKRACQIQLKQRGLDVGAFVMDGAGGRVRFKQCSREEALGAKVPRAGCTMYVVADPAASGKQRLLKAVKGEGMPTLKNPFAYGNLFLILTVEFPDRLTAEQQASLRQALPPPLTATELDKDDPSVEVHTLIDLDPRASRVMNAPLMQAGGEAYDEDENVTNRGMGGQCQQM